MICVSLGNMSFAEASKIASEENMVEIRADLLHFSYKQLTELLLLANKSIFTCRPGNYSDSERKELFTMAIENNASFIDLEIESEENFLAEIKSLIETSHTELILSYHNFLETPSVEELSRILSSCYLSGAELAKIATMIRRNEDLQTLFSLYSKPGRKVLIGMGENGIITRVAATFLGSEFSFASPENSEKTASGQLSVGEMKEILKILKAEENTVSSPKT